MLVNVNTISCALTNVNRLCGFKKCPLIDIVYSDVLCQLTAPYASWIGSHNITLTWKALNQSDVLYIPQWTGPSLSGVWAQAENVTESTYTVEQLEPFTCYKFRVWAVIAEEHMCSLESLWYQTEPFGLPSSPSIDSIESLSGESVDVHWSPPEKPAGPILGFNLNFTTNIHVISVATGGNVFFTTFFPTLHNTTYRISIAAVNREGQGSVAEAGITTPEQVEQDGGRWVFASRWNTLRRREKNADFFTTAECLSDTLIESNITGVAMHYSSNKVYFAEGTHIWVKGAENLTDHSDLKLLYSVDVKVTALTVDWLYQRIYYVSSGSVFYCGIDDCTFPVHVNLTLPSDPLDIIADPYNGFLFLLLPNGIFRAPLLGQQDEMSHIVNTSPKALYDLVVSFPNKRLIFHDRKDQTLKAVSLDGLHAVTLYTSIKFEATSIAYEDDFFMFSDGRALYKQVGQGQVAIFNEFPMDCDDFSSQYEGFGNICYFSPLAQPYPVPQRPRNLQILFGSDKANVYWDKPEIMIGASSSAWQNWTYFVNCSLNGLLVTSFSGVTSTHVTVSDLESSHRYCVSVRACSPGGCSRSVSFEGSTLHAVDEAPYIVVADGRGIWKQDLDSNDFLEPLVSNIKDVKDIDSYNGTIYWTNSSGHINWVELGDQSLSGNVITIPLSMKAESVAFDWLGQYLYWSCNSNQICRGSTSSQHVEIFHQADDKILSLVIDSLNAAIYWTTKTSVEGCRLDGEGYQLLDKMSVFSGREVAGITLNVMESSLYWLVKDGTMVNLYRANFRGDRMQKSKGVEYVQWTTSQIFNHHVGYYSGRLLWLDENKQLRIQEMNQTTSVRMSSTNTLTAFSIVQEMLKPLPDGFLSPPVVIPPAVPKTSVRVEGNHAFFQILWDASNIDFGNVFYCVVSKETSQNAEQLQNNYPTRYCPPGNSVFKPVINVTRFKPDTEFNITITPFSYWGKGVSTSMILFTPGMDTPKHTNITLVIVITAICVCVALIGILAAVIWQRRHKKRDHGTFVQTGVHLHTDEELEYIRGLVGLGNACYAVSAIPAQREIESLPVFPRDCLKLQRLLGSGAFGEVYEGITTGCQITEIGSEERVAVKTLHTGASEYEKAEFLKEVSLMSQFNHSNILRLLGVCLLNEPHYLILELMEGGDLLSYLRGARPTNNRRELLNLTSLLDIGLDAAKGCAYLERMRFVHRDIAARNCLVSVKSYTDPNRIIKIGDFGLARDVYKNDYYRKRGEGLLPVRWMSPESLTDGIFNKFSDVWAFGVLLWEIMTLGKQPYPTYTNHEVLSYISHGGQLPSPTGCAQRLYNLMMDCWKKEPTERPSFQQLQETLNKLRDYEADKETSQNMTPGHVNQAYQEDDLSEEVCTGVDEDEDMETGLSPVLSNDRLNYLMYKAESPDSVQTDTTTESEDR
ncbi:putative proto-oncogene tyrosine-protein kinase ROS [Triplophysa rosa]|uniref:Tyrosine-protein kinase receptor n=1 Tax=Triplophysa rosa TaxID=992332 RepID=A0A9W7TW73_TRIRA|nr:putative proto-oncogene tyrosine-protein kinase ROS [Triplophysa rosa]